MKLINTILILISIIVILLIIIIILLKKDKNKESYLKIDSSKVDENICKQWFINRSQSNIINPLTGEGIKKNKKTYKDLNKICKQYTQIQKKNYKSLLSVPMYLKPLYKMLFEKDKNGDSKYVKLITDKPSTEYNRKKFTDGWSKVGNSECDIRSLVLHRENIGDIIFNPSKCELNSNCNIDELKCTIYSGVWNPTTGSYFKNDPNPFYKFAKLLDVDHTVPLKHVYYHGGFKWSKAIREKYANDLTPGHLLTMVNYLNTEKGDKDPSEWLPPNGELKYISNWLAVKYRYGLIIEPAEFNAIQDILEKYKDFIPDEHLNINDNIGYSLKNKNESKFDPSYKLQRQIFIDDFNNLAFNNNDNIKTICQNNKSKLDENIKNLFKKELTNYNFHTLFGLLRPEYIDLIKNPEDICNYIE
jgi:hypothetical protein